MGKGRKERIVSILQEYEEIRREIGEERFQRIEAFLALHPDLFLSDVYYKETVWKLFEEYEATLS